MDFLSAYMPWIMGGVAAVIAVALLCGPLKWLGRIIARTAFGVVILFLVSKVGGLIGIQLGVNMLNALCIGVLGAPGFGLLLLFDWML
ncbi:MAG: pro-sigmaK processing inhibitor BofA family protein [Oscillospiraceae bacterium]|nr:pro-sigmaK processing inhibitor BofA family protein [Oscillospiraceae bacterium]